MPCCQFEVLHSFQFLVENYSVEMAPRSVLLSLAILYTICSSIDRELATPTKQRPFAPLKYVATQLNLPTSQSLSGIKYNYSDSSFMTKTCKFLQMLRSHPKYHQIIYKQTQMHQFRQNQKQNYFHYHLYLYWIAFAKIQKRQSAQQENYKKEHHIVV